MDGVTLAHGIGGAKDLPISTELVVAGAVAAITVSFTVLALAWRTPRYDDATSGRPAPGWLRRIVDAPAYRLVLRAFGIALLGYTLWAAALGKDSLINPVFGMFYVLLWVGLVFASLLLGRVWRAISPFRAVTYGLCRLSGADPATGLFRYPARWGHWPAAAGLFAFVWMELAFPGADELGSVRVWIAVYAAVMLVGGALFGYAFHENADPFEVYSTLVAHLSVWGRRGDLLVVRSPLANLHSTPVRPGLVAVVSVLFGSTAFDSFKDSTAWLTRVQSSEHPLLLDNLALLAFCLLVGTVFSLGTMATGVGKDVRRRDLPGLFAHSVVPIVVGYIVAHYLSFLFVSGQATLIQMSDPLSNGSNLLGTADWSVSYWLVLHPSLLASIKVLAVVTGHVLGVVAAHDRAIALLPKRHQLTGQLPLLFTMIAFTAGGLYLLFAA
ncbi:MAG TPA: hypothetical protein PLP61_03865 [Nocardioides sp.]|uniref:hypothetical protein n=1 Tax=Nocardioides sp. TaxID=35761 RepID=UPI002CB273C6|nr:hypothetical protein [Nocardioides sp.]HQR26158.1 hypothetical protein [Nocardioides sp.]